MTDEEVAKLSRYEIQEVGDRRLNGHLVAHAVLRRKASGVLEEFMPNVGSYENAKFIVKALKARDDENRKASEQPGGAEETARLPPGPWSPVLLREADWGSDPHRRHGRRSDLARPRGLGSISQPPLNSGENMITGNILIGGKHVAQSRTDPVKIWFFIVLGILVATSLACWHVLTAKGGV